jgi:hypothetical protein
LSRLQYPQARTSDDLQQQINLLLEYVADPEFAQMTKDWILQKIETAPKDPVTTKALEYVRNISTSVIEAMQTKHGGELAKSGKQAEQWIQGGGTKDTVQSFDNGQKYVDTLKKESKGSEVVYNVWLLLFKDYVERYAAQDGHWLMEMANSVQELAVAGTFRAALAGKISLLVTSLLTTMLAHLDRNGGLVLAALNGLKPRRDVWFLLTKSALYSPIAQRFHQEALRAHKETVTDQHEVITDACTKAVPFASRYPVSWYISNLVDPLRDDAQAKDTRLAALEAQFKFNTLCDIGFDPNLKMVGDYLYDFNAMHVNYYPNIDREKQTDILQKILERKLGRRLKSVLEIHQGFWAEDKFIAWVNALLNEAPKAIPKAEKIIETGPEETFDLDILLLVQTCLAEDLSQPPDELNGWTASIFLRDWNTRKRVVTGLTKDWLALKTVQDGDKLTELKSVTDPRLDTLSLFLSHVAMPAKLHMKIVSKFAQSLMPEKDKPAGKIRRANTLAAVLKIAPDLKNDDPELKHTGAFAEAFILDVCLGSPSTLKDLDEYLFKLFCSVASGLALNRNADTTAGIDVCAIDTWEDFVDAPLATIAVNEKGSSWLSAGVKAAIAIPRTNYLNLAMERKLMVISEGDQKVLACATIEALLKDLEGHVGHNDTTAATRYCIIQEELAERTMKQAGLLQNVEKWPDFNLNEIYKSSKPAHLLTEIGKLRVLLREYAEVFKQDPINRAKHDLIAKKLTPILQTDDDTLKPVVRSMRLFFLKCIDREKGSSFVRGACATEPLCDAEWMQTWRTENDLDFGKFIGAALVPKWSPFRQTSEKHVSEEHKEAKTAVMELMMSTSVEKLDDFAAKVARSPEDKRKDYIGGLLLALCEEPGLNSALEDPAITPPWRPKLNDWLATNTMLPVTDHTRMLLRIFSGNSKVFAGCSESAFFKPFILTQNPTMDDILRWRFLGHMASVLISAHDDSCLNALKVLMLNPDTLGAAMTAGSPPFLPGMDEDIRKRVLDALLEKGENIWKHKSHWYECVCGYQFMIGECGRPMEISKCPECGRDIGGRDHAATGNTKEQDEHDRSPYGYMLPPADKDEKSVSFRGISASPARAIRLLLHGAMYCGVAARVPSNGKPMEKVYAQLVSPDSQCTLASCDESRYLGDLWLNDLTQMAEMLSSNVEDVVITFHALLGNMSGKVDDGASQGWGHLDLSLRAKWEATMESKYLKATVKDFNEKLNGLFTQYSESDDDGKFVSELKETVDLKDFPLAKRKAEMPQVWSFRAGVTLNALKTRLGSEDARKLPVLNYILCFPGVQDGLAGLSSIAGMFEWFALVNNRLSGRISKSEAMDLTVDQVLDTFEGVERQKAESAWNAYERCFKLGWPLVEKFQCTDIEELLGDKSAIQVSRDASIEICIPSDKGIGIVPQALSDFFFEMHNELVQLSCGKASMPEIFTTLMQQHHVIDFSQTALLQFLKGRCVSWGTGGKVFFDLQQLEHRLRRETTRNPIQMQIKAFQWCGATSSRTAELSAAIKQKDITSEICERIKKEISSPSVANSCMQRISVAITFILKAAGSNSERSSSGEMFLADYMSKVLCDSSSDCLPSSTARSEIRLVHIDALMRLLKAIIKADPMDKVDERFKVDLPEDVKKAILAVKDGLPASLCLALGEFGEGFLGMDSGIGPETAFMESLEPAVEAEMVSLSQMELATVKEKLPEDLRAKLQVQHWEKLYRLLQK